MYQLDVLLLIGEREIFGFDINGYWFAKFMNWTYSMVSCVLKLVYKVLESMPYHIFYGSMMVSIFVFKALLCVLVSSYIGYSRSNRIRVACMG